MPRIGGLDTLQLLQSASGGARSPEDPGDDTELGEDEVLYEETPFESEMRMSNFSLPCGWQSGLATTHRRLIALSQEESFRPLLTAAPTTGLGFTPAARSI